MKLQSIKQRYGIIGRSEALDNALGIAVRVAPTDLSVLVSGESGVGKEAFSSIIHALSPRKHNKFIAINCGAIPAGTINSELFGHEKGAFTGAASDRKGYFETVNGGTIFLDEISEMPIDTQAYLLRILESGEFLRVGSSRILKTDVRIIAASNVNLMEKVQEKKFREDLYYRLNTVPIHVPALRERREDIHVLLRKFAVDFAEKYGTRPIILDEDSTRILEMYGWPGNIRELKNVVEQLSVLSEQRDVDAGMLLEIMPHLRERNLPAIRSKPSESSLPEREILYKFLFDMKTDLNDLKSLVFELVARNDLQLPENRGTSSLLRTDLQKTDDQPLESMPWMKRPQSEYGETDNKEKEAIIIPKSVSDNTKTIELEENLSLEDMEKEMIIKALQKYKGKRKNAASELGISERTLYRKIKQYDIVE
jgi:DNA-binding NtrC family response regulator